MGDDGPWNTGGSGTPPPRRPQFTPGGPGAGNNLPPELADIADRLRRMRPPVLRGGAGRLGLIALVAVAAIWLATGFYRVEPDEQALVLRFGAFARTSPPGLNYHLPWPVESVLLLPVTRINRVEIGFRSSGAEEPEVTPRTPEGSTEPTRGLPVRDLAEESLMLTGDENIVDINASVFWRIRDAAAFAFATRNPGYTVKSVAESKLREVMGHTRIEAALTGGRAAIEQAVADGTQHVLDQYGSGVEVTQVQLQKVDPPEAVIESFRDVQRANTDADTARNEAQAYENDVVPRARGEAAAIVARAEGERAATIARSQGEAKRFLAVYAAYAQAKDVTLRRLYIETMESILARTPSIVVDPGLRGVLPLLPLGGAEKTP